MDNEREVDQATRRAFFDQVRRHTGIAMSERKWTLLEGRLRRRVRELALPGYRDYLHVLEAKPEEVRDFIDLVTTNETSFFHTPRIWEYFAGQFLPRWFETHGGTPLRVWSAAASSGEEAYTVAMLCEEFRERHPAFRYRILATDIGDAILRKAAAAHYQATGEANRGYLNVAAFCAISTMANPCSAPVPSGGFGNTGRNAFRGIPSYQFDAQISRIFPIHDSLALDLRLEAFNVLNHPNFSNPSASNPSTSNSTFGQISGSSAARIFQGAVKLTF